MNARHLFIPWIIRLTLRLFLNFSVILVLLAKTAYVIRSFQLYALDRYVKNIPFLLDKFNS